jgi:hypothetical protein
MIGAVRGGRLPSHRAEGSLRARGPAHRRSDARARPAPVAAASPRATNVRPPADPACSHSCASRRARCRSPRRLPRRYAVRPDPGVLTLERRWRGLPARCGRRMPPRPPDRLLNRRPTRDQRRRRSGATWRSRPCPETRVSPTGAGLSYQLMSPPAAHPAPAGVTPTRKAGSHGHARL